MTNAILATHRFGKHTHRGEIDAPFCCQTPYRYRLRSGFHRQYGIVKHRFYFPPVVHKVTAPQANERDDGNRYGPQHFLQHSK
jgi:hypothetical protein